MQDAGQFAGVHSVQAVLGDPTANDALGNLRFTWEPTYGAWSFQLHYEVSAEDGPDVALAHAEAGLLPRPPATWLNLTDTFENKGLLAASQTIDRLAVAYSTPEWVVRVGRQALTWGSGLVFRPMDLFDPFSPSAVDTEWKPGVDMLYVQRLFADGSDLQLIVAPRPERHDGPVRGDASSFALHYHATLLGHETTLLAAFDHGDWVTGLGVNGALGGATWNLEAVPTVLHHGGAVFSGIANLSNAVTLFGHNATVFGEYFRNGFGVSGGPFDLQQLPRALLNRLERGQLFNLRRDELAAGLTYEANPLLTLSPTLILDADDGSAFALFAATYSLGNNVSLIGGIEAPLGRTHTEYGGVPLTPASPTLFAAPAQLYLQLRRYF